MSIQREKPEGQARIVNPEREKPEEQARIINPERETRGTSKNYQSRERNPRDKQELSIQREKPEGQARIVNPETRATLGTGHRAVTNNTPKQPTTYTTQKTK